MGQNEQTPAAKLTVSNRAGSLRSAVIRQGSALSGDVDPGGLTVSNVVAGVPDGVARFSIRIVESNLDGTVLISGSVTAVKLGTQITRATWNWGDGSSEEIVFPLEHAYPGSGTYTMTATAFNNLGNQQSISLTVVIPKMFADASLEAAVREQIGKPEGDILPEDVDELGVLRLEGLGIRSVQGIQHLAALQDLDLDGNQIADMGPLWGLPSLTSLSARENQLTDVSGISALTTLRNLDLSENSLGNDALAEVASLTGLTGLAMNNNQFDTISDLAELTSLEFLSLGGNGLDDEDFAVVSNLTSLSALQVIFNQISDLSPVASLTALESLEVRGNQISDLSPLIGLTLLSHIQIDINQISDLLPLVDNSGIGEGDTVLLGQNPLSADAISTQIPALEARGVLVSEDTR